MMFESTVKREILQLKRPGTRWLSTGWAGGLSQADAAYNVSVPDGWDRTDVGAYVDERRGDAGFTVDGPALLTGVDLAHARGARAGPVEVYATVGLSNPAALPIAPDDPPTSAASADSAELGGPGTVNLIVGTPKALEDGALASLLAVAVEAKTATLLAETGFPGTTTDAVIVGTDPTGEPTEFAGSATTLGGSARACVREAVRASLRSRYADEPVPATVDEATYGLRTTERADVFTP